jgi:RimJ/RimL family protein N-acetyltransferase
MMRFDVLGRPLGEELQDWHGAGLPQKQVLAGRLCRMEPFCARLHASSLRAALELDRQGSNWTYLMQAPQDDDEWRRWFSTMETSVDPLYFAIVCQRSQQAEGIAAFQRIDPVNGVMEFGRLLFSPLLQRTAVATEAMYLMLRQAFSLGYRRVEWQCNTLNKPSWRAAERMGFSFEGIFRQAKVKSGLNRDSAWFSLLDCEWPQMQQALEAWLSPDNFAPDGRQKNSLAACRQAIVRAETET